MLNCRYYLHILFEDNMDLYSKSRLTNKQNMKNKRFNDDLLIKFVLYLIMLKKSIE